MNYDASNWYWTVAGDVTRAYSSARHAYVPASDTIYMAWLAAGNRATRILNEAELSEELAKYNMVLGAADSQDAVLDRILAGRGTREDFRDVMISLVKTIASLHGVTLTQARDALKANMPPR